MKIKTDIDNELTVPKIIEDTYETDRKKYLDTEEAYEDFNDWWFEEGLGIFKGKIVSKEIAEFIIGMEINFIPHEGGWPITFCFEFEDNGYKYSIYAYGWANIDKPKISMVGYKERKEVIK